MKILMVEDNPTFSALACNNFLTSHDVKVAATLKAARSALDSESFDAVLVDFDLPDGKGNQLVTWIRQRPPTQKVPIVAISSHERGNRRLLAAGANTTCSKMHFKKITKALAKVASKT